MKKKCIVIIVLFVIPIFTDAQTWEQVGGEIVSNDSIYDSPIYALCVYKDRLYVGGDFTKTGNLKANNIACWDGQKWNSVGSGVNGDVRALCVYKGQLYVGGNFTIAGSKHANKIAKWDGNRWLPLGSGLAFVFEGKVVGNGCVRALCVYHNELYVCGDFTEAGGKPANFIAKWDSLHWSGVGEPLKATSEFYKSEGAGISLRASFFAVYSNKLYVGGWLDRVGDFDVNFGSWNGQEWDSVPGVLWRKDTIPAISPLGEYKEKLLVSSGDKFLFGKHHIGIYAWNDTNWSVFEGEMRGDNLELADALCVDSNNLYIGGFFSKIGDLQVNNIAKWDGLKWNSLGNGLSRGNLRPMRQITLPVSSQVIFEGYLYASGYFNSTGRKPLKHIARWKLNK